LQFFIIILFFFGFLQITCSASPKYSSVVIDGGSGRILHGVNELDARYPASLTKKMTLYLLFEALAQKRITLKTRFRVSPRAQIQRPSKLGVEAGETIEVETIIKALIVRSANDIAVVAAEGLGGSVERFAIKMTEKARALGMENTVFKNPSGVNDACTTDKGQYTTAKDQAILGISLYRDFPQHTHYFKIEKFIYNGNVIRTHNHMLGKIHGLDGIKTGFAVAPGFNISTSALRYDQNHKPHRIFVVVMGGKSWRSRDRHAEELIEHGFKLLGCPSNYNEAPKRLDIIEDAGAIEKILNKKPAEKLFLLSKKNSIQKILISKRKKKTKLPKLTDSISYLLKNTKKPRVSRIKYKKISFSGKKSESRGKSA
jgi:D-alanyl-D-alanine carboxypeptidase